MTVLSFFQVAEAAREAGWSAPQAVVAVSITTCESGRNDTIVQAGQPYDTTGWGLWQITPGDSVPQVAINDGLLAALPNARAAYIKSDGGTDWTPWTTWVDGCNQQYVPQAEAAVARAFKVNPEELRRQVAALPHAGAHGGPDSGSAHDWSPQVKLASGHLAAHGLHLAATHKVLHGLAAHLVVPKVVVPAPSKVLLPARRFNGSE